MLENRTKAKLAAGESVFGCFVRTPEPQLIEYVGMLGWDFLVFDAEHGPLQPREVEDLCRRFLSNPVIEDTAITVTPASVAVG